MSEKTTKDKKERTLSLKPGLVSSTKAKGSRSSRASTVVVESRRGRLSQTRKPVAPSVRVRKAPAAPNVFKPKKENESEESKQSSGGVVVMDTEDEEEEHNHDSEGECGACRALK